jgi:ubiquinone/menaquinone biosynthesis C-methylase UbiE
MLRFARFLTRSSDDVLRYAQGSAEALPLADSSVTVAWSIASVHHWNDLHAGLQETRRVLKHGGRLVAIERLSKPGARGLAGHGWTPDQAEAFADGCIAHGFTDAKVNQHGSGRRTKVSVTATAP